MRDRPVCFLQKRRVLLANAYIARIRHHARLPEHLFALFDATVTEYLPMEDIVVLAGMVAARLRD